MNGRVNYFIKRLPRGGEKHNRARVSVDYHDCTNSHLNDLVKELGPGEYQEKHSYKWFHWEMGNITVNAFV